MLTLDVDWAPDCAIRHTAKTLVEHGVRATWFVTHISPAIHELRRHPQLFELGIHPNFLPGSTHGNKPEEVLDHCMKLAPEATSMRTHGLMQWTGLLRAVLARTPIVRDVSLFLPGVPPPSPTEFWSGHKMLLRIPFFWEDDYEMERPKPGWSLEPLLQAEGGLRIFNFHPMHVYLNSSSPDAYERVKRDHPRLAEAEAADLDPLVRTGEGVRSIFLELVTHLAGRGSLRIQDVHVPQRD